MFKLLYADDKGRFYDHPGLLAAARTGERITEIRPEEMIPMPPGSSLVFIPGGSPVGIDRRGNFVLLKEAGGKRALAVAALLPQGYTRTLLPAYYRSSVRPLPLFGYAAVAWRKGRVWVAAHRTDDPARWDPRHYNTPDLPGRIARRLAESPHNPVLRQLARCAQHYSCFTAQNIFYCRWEGGLPVSPACNAGCLGCISRQPAGRCPSPQERIKEAPPQDAVVEVMEHHLARAPEAIISFGQGCEGEPLLQADLVAGAIARVRSRVSRGTINMNTNAGSPEGVRKVVEAGINSLRVSLFSADPELYNLYHRPRGFGLGEVAASIKLARRAGVFVSLNLLVMPGFTDRAGEVEKLLSFLAETGVNMVQLRNLNIDPDYLFRHLPPAKGELLGVPGLIARLREIKGLAVGSCNRAL
ncbi:radical SAM protein [Desulfovirgula thermocuniculi]|uniref:radical SAM protein n=1 Tax=Desulfovirgula thermocuniculi TaxID=348842 RepID=UPI0003F8BCEA|nr:radical SAM protein [Desulfovirgula thermocuniculi]